MSEKGTLPFSRQHVVLHLFHPALVHVTVAFLVVGGIVEAFGLMRRRDVVERFGSILVVTGTVSLLPTMLAGFLASNSLTLAEGAWNQARAKPSSAHPVWAGASAPNLPLLRPR